MIWIVKRQLKYILIFLHHNAFALKTIEPYNQRVFLLKTDSTCLHLKQNKGCFLMHWHYVFFFFLASMVPQRTFNIHGTFPLPKRFFIVEKGSSLDVLYTKKTIFFYWKVLWGTKYVCSKPFFENVISKSAWYIIQINLSLIAVVLHWIHMHLVM